MPLVRISVHSSSTGSQRAASANSVYEAMRETIDIPGNDRLIVHSSHGKQEMFIDPYYMDVQRTGAYVLIQIFLSRRRFIEKKQTLYARIADLLHQEAQVPHRDVMVVLTENNVEDWSVGNRVAQYVLNPPAWAQKAREGN